MAPSSHHRCLWIDRGWSAPPQPGAKQLIQIIGVKGAGKTSHLKHWQAQTGGPYCYYPPGWDRVKLPVVSPIAGPIHQRIAYWDEADRIPTPVLVAALLTAAQTSHTIIVGTHKDLSYAQGYFILKRDLSKSSPCPALR